MPIDQHHEMAARAASILQANDTGTSIKAAPSLYPHQWSWDAALVAVGLADLSVDRAVQEIRSLLRGQWSSGLIPQIVYNPDVPAEAYFPDAKRWDVAHCAPDAPKDVPTSGIMQPPVHASALWGICERATPEQARAIADEFYEPLLRWHRYLMTVRDPEVSGLVTIVHPWESGMDNSPRWDRALARIDVPEGGVPLFTRRDLAHVADPDERPTDADYERYMWVVEVLRQGECRVDRLYETLPFRVKDVFSSALLVASNEALIRIANLTTVDVDDLSLIESWIDRGRLGLADQWDPDLGLCCDFDVIDQSPILVSTIATFAPLVAGQLTVEMRTALKQLWESEAFTGHPENRWALPPSTSPLDPAFVPARYWRGPVWPVMNWLLWWAWTRNGEEGIADRIREQSLDQIATVGFAEYVNPFTGDPLGSQDQSWTAAAVLNWLSGG